MKVKIRNRSNKKRSLSAMQELKDFSIHIAKELGIENKIILIQLNYTKGFSDYYPKGKPMFGFHKLFKNKKVKIDFARYWDYSQTDRKEAIVHELTHVKQMVDKRLIISRDFKNVIWKGRPNQSWKKWRFKIFNELTRKEKNKYTAKLLPWEAEVQSNINALVK